MVIKEEPHQGDHAVGPSSMSAAAPAEVEAVVIEILDSDDERPGGSSSVVTQPMTPVDAATTEDRAGSQPGAEAQGDVAGASGPAGSTMPVSPSSTTTPPVAAAAAAAAAGTSPSARGTASPPPPPPTPVPVPATLPSLLRQQPLIPALQVIRITHNRLAGAASLSPAPAQQPVTAPAVKQEPGVEVEHTLGPHSPEPQPPAQVRPQPEVADTTAAGQQACQPGALAEEGAGGEAEPGPEPSGHGQGVGHQGVQGRGGDIDGGHTSGGGGDDHVTTQFTPAWDTSKPGMLLVPVPYTTARHIRSVQLEVGGVLLPPSCTADLSPSFCHERQVLVISTGRAKRAYMEWLQSADVLAARVTQRQQPGGGGTKHTGAAVLQLCATWHLKPLGQVGGINAALYGTRLPGSWRSTKQQCTSAHFSQHSLQALQLEYQSPASSSIHIMAAFERDGTLIPLQQPAEIRRHGGDNYLTGWPGRGVLMKNTTLGGCFRWLPKAGEGAVNGKSMQPVSSSGAGDGSTQHHLAPGLLVLQVTSLPVPGVARITMRRHKRIMEWSSSSDDTDDEDEAEQEQEQQQEQEQHGGEEQAVAAAWQRAPPARKANVMAAARIKAAALRAQYKKRTARVPLEGRGRQRGSGLLVRTGTAAICHTDDLAQHHEAGAGGGDHEQKQQRKHGRGLKRIKGVSATQTTRLKKSAVHAGGKASQQQSEHPRKRAKTGRPAASAKEEQETGSRKRPRSAAKGDRRKRHGGTFAQQEPEHSHEDQQQQQRSAFRHHLTQSPSTQLEQQRALAPPRSVSHIRAADIPAPAAGAPSPHLPAALPAPLPQLPHFTSAALQDPWTRPDQVTALLQLALAVRGPAGMDEVAIQLQEMEAEVLQRVMAQCYHPLQQLQAMGGGQAAVCAMANKLLDKLMMAS